MKIICETCGGTLQSGLSRTLGRCGPCRAGEDNGQDYPPPPPDLRRVREAPAPGTAPPTP
ncbi:MAG: hypothetical protein AMXMBFR80_26820 [Dehalococcoidia bacterium]|nr:hypothetical protein [Tepidiformaceae bacterium]